METILLKAEKRADIGKKAAKSYRNRGKIPCVMYGGEKPEKLAVDTILLFKALSGDSATRVILKIDVDGKEHNAILRELQYHPITDKFIHADFLEIDLKKPMKAKLPVRAIGESVGVKMKGGELRYHLKELSVECLPEIMPSEIEVDVTDLDIGDAIKVGEIPVSEGIVKNDPEDTSVVLVAMPKIVEEEKPAEEEEEGAEGEAVAEGEEKPAEEGAAKGSAEDKKTEKK
ncbi:MAG: 50S ribosomal protein L25 [Nitrospinota bacterium]